MRFNPALIYRSRLALLAFCGMMIAQPALALNICLDSGGFRSTARSLRPEVLVLPGGEQVLLAGIQIPENVAVRAITEIKKLISGHSLRYVPQAAVKDRYQRVPADVVVDSPQPVWLQEKLVEQGLALAFPFSPSSACRKGLLAAEDRARIAKMGLWSGLSPVLSTEDEGSLKNASGRFVIVEGRLRHVAVRDYAAFLNFGQKKGERFSVILLKKDKAVFPLATTLQSLTGKTLRVRGVIDANPSPRMTLEQPEALEILP